MRIKLDPYAYPPVRAHPTDAGMDIRTPIDFNLKAHSAAVINTGVHVELPKGTVGMLKSKSGLNIRAGIVGEGVIDEGYTGPIRIKLYNHGNHDKQFLEGDKITQLVVMPVLYPEIEIVSEIRGGERGSEGFGSTGR